MIVFFIYFIFYSIVRVIDLDKLSSSAVDVKGRLFLDGHCIVL